MPPNHTDDSHELFAAIVPPDRVSSQAEDDLSQAELANNQSLSKKRLEAKDDFIQSQRQLSLQFQQQELDLREKYAGRVYWFVLGWSVVLVVLLSISGWPWFSFHLSDNVIVVLITGVVANCITAFITVTRSLFPKKDR